MLESRLRLQKRIFILSMKPETANASSSKKLKDTPQAAKWSVLDKRVQSMVLDIARWFAVDPLESRERRERGFKSFFGKYFPNFSGVTANSCI